MGLGFLDFVTTVSDTVIKFTSQGGPGNTPAFNLQSSAILGSDFNSNYQEPHSSFIEVKSSQHDPTGSNEIQPSAVRNTGIHEGVKHLANGDQEIDGASDQAMYDKVSEESELAAEEGFTVEDVSPTESSEYYYNDNGDDIDQEKEVTTKKPVSSLRSRTRPNIRKSASQAYKERLRKRVEKEKVKLQLAELASKKFSSRTHAKKYNEPEEETGTEAPRFKSRSRSIARARSFETDEVFTEAENEEEAQARSLSGFGSRSSRPVRQRPSFRRNRFSQSRESNSGFKPRTSSFSSRNRFKSRFEKAESEEITRAPQTTKKSVSTRKKSSGFFDSGEKENKNPVVIKKFNKFERPDYRETLLKKLFDKRPDIKQRIEERKKK